MCEIEKKENQIIENFAEILPKISEKDKEYLLGVGDGFKLAHRAKTKESRQSEDQNYDL